MLSFDPYESDCGRDHVKLLLTLVPGAFLIGDFGVRTRPESEPGRSSRWTRAPEAPINVHDISAGSVALRPGSLRAPVLLTMSTQPTQNHHERAYMSLMRGLRELDLRGPAVPSDLVLTGDHAFPLAMNSKGQVLMAASLYGHGRIVLLGHEAYLTAFPALVENALTWLRGDGSDNVSVGIHRNVKTVANNLSKASFQASVVGAFSDNPRVGVYVTDAYSVGADPKDLVAFLKAGGGSLIAGQAWSWAADTKENLQEKFGWDAFKKVFAAYHGMSNFPGNNEGKMNLYAETFSKTVGMNLCGFFKAWGWPIKPDTEKKVSNLPPWKDHPMVHVGEDPKDLVAFLKAGGGVLIAGQAWSWASSHPKENVLLNFGGNKVSGVAGIYFSQRVGEREYVPIYPQIPSSGMAVATGKDFEDDLEFLLQGVLDFDLQGGTTASEVLVHGPLSFPIGTSEDGKVFLAGAYYGQGRVIVVSHEGLLGRETLAPFWINAIHWLDEGRQGVVGVEPNHALEVLSESGLNCEKTNFRKDLSVFVCTAYSDQHAEEIQNFVAEGGGLLIGGHAWYWMYSHSGQNPLTDFAGDLFKAPVPREAAKDSYHFRHLLHRFAGHVNKGSELTQSEQGCLKKLGRDCSAYLSLKAHSCPDYTQVLSTLTDVVLRAGMPQPCENPQRAPAPHCGGELYEVCSNPDALLPHLIKDSPLMPAVYNHRIVINVNTAEREEWVSTGLYLCPGMKTYIIIPANIVNNGWEVQIGCQTDKLKAEELKRPPSVHKRFPITSEMMQVWNLWGGLIYLVAPPKTQVEGAEVTVQMAVSAPYYKSGLTTAADWTSLRTSPSPWAELEFENIILTVPSSAVRDLESPDELAALWDAMMRGIADLAAIPHKFPEKNVLWQMCRFPMVGCMQVIPS
ncbi:hypothetical protein INR49_001743 [Caranx melampygus]|nr:hypothetical protein INR49_001743 [Caranx melampygus]